MRKENLQLDRNPHTHPPIALITGGSSGIGSAFARKLAAMGCHIILAARREDRMRLLAKELEDQNSVQVDWLVSDLSQPADVERLEACINGLPAIEYFIHCAGFGIPGNFADTPMESVAKMLQVHLLASTHLTKTALPKMLAQESGKIINVASIGAFFPKPGDAVYCATKAYLTTFSQALFRELRGTGVYVQALCPGFVRTEFFDQPAYQKRFIKNKLPNWMWTPVDQVVEESFLAIKRNQPICVPPLREGQIKQFCPVHPHVQPVYLYLVFAFPGSG
jgi:short-subunit dehydrogenase